MADTAVAVTPGSGANIDSRTEDVNGNHRQVVVLGDPTSNTGVAPVDATNGLGVDVKALVDMPGGTIDTVSAITALPDLPGGTVDLVTAVTTVGTVADVGQIHNAGTVAGLPDLPGGTVDSVTAVTAVTNLDAGTVSMLEAGTVTEVGTVTGAGTVAAIGVIHNAGTVAELPDLPGGTVDLVTAVTTVGTVTGAGTVASIGQVHNAGTVAALTGSVDGSGAPTIDSYTQASVNLGAGADQSLVAAPGASKQIWVYSILLTCSVAGQISIQDEDNTAITGIMDFAANSGLAISPSGNFAMPIWKVATNKALEVDATDAAIDGWVSYGIASV